MRASRFPCIRTWDFRPCSSGSRARKLRIGPRGRGTRTRRRSACPARIRCECDCKTRRTPANLPRRLAARRNRGHRGFRNGLHRRPRRTRTRPGCTTSRPSSDRPCTSSPTAGSPMFRRTWSVTCRRGCRPCPSTSKPRRLQAARRSRIEEKEPTPRRISHRRRRCDACVPVSIRGTFRSLFDV